MANEFRDDADDLAAAIPKARSHGVDQEFYAHVPKSRKLETAK